MMGDPLEYKTVVVELKMDVEEDDIKPIVPGDEINTSEETIIFDFEDKGHGPYPGGPGPGIQGKGQRFAQTKVTTASIIPCTVTHTQLQTQQAHRIELNNGEKGQEQHNHSRNATPQPIINLAWEEAANAAVLPIRCKEVNAELYKAKFGSGTKGKCVKAGDEWFTPTEFEAFSGRGSSKDWKRSIHFGGRTLQFMMDKGYLVPHAATCICHTCVDDSSATVPVKPYTPRKRARKSRDFQGDTSKSKLAKRLSQDYATDESSDVGTPVTPFGTTTCVDLFAQALMKIAQTSPPTTEEAWTNLEDMAENLVQGALLMKQMVKDMKERSRQETKPLRSQLQEQQEIQNLQNLSQAQQTQQQQEQAQTTVDGTTRNLIESPQVLRIFDPNRIQTYTIQVVDTETFKKLQAQSTG